MDRRLAHIEKVEALFPIDGADKIEVCQVLGWQCVVKKGEFWVGDTIVYIEVDSVVPEKPEYEFLRDRKFRVRTIKLRGQVSQGLVVPCPDECKSYEIGTDVTEAMGISKYLSPSEQSELQREDEKIKLEKNRLKKFMMRYSWFRRMFLSRKKKGGFPYWVSKTDEERIQNIPQVLELFKGCYVYVTEKIDYQSGTFTGKMVTRIGGVLGGLLPKRFQFVVCSRNLTNNDHKSLYWRIANKYGLEQILRSNPALTIQGEQGNTNVQGNKYGIKEPTLWVFNIIDHERGYHFNYDEMSAFCQKHGLTPVPLIAKCKLSDIGSSVKDFVEYSKGKSVLADIEREGVVIRCVENGKKVLSFKIINPNFLLKHED